MANKSRLQTILEGHVENSGNGQVRSYSGRAMYGRECLGIDTSAEIGELFADVLAFVEGEGDTSELQDAFREMRSDAMGRGTIYYWPSIPYVDEDEIDGDEEHDCDDPSCCFQGEDPHAVAQYLQHERLPQT